MKLNGFLSCLLVVSLSVVLVGCGSSGVPSDNAARQPVPSDIINEPAVAEPMTDTDFFDLTIANDTDESGNVEDGIVADMTTRIDANNYWNGDNYFDLYGYLNAIGATDIEDTYYVDETQESMPYLVLMTQFNINGWNCSYNLYVGGIHVNDGAFCYFDNKENNNSPKVIVDEIGSYTHTGPLEQLLVALPIMANNAPRGVCPLCGFSEADVKPDQLSIVEKPIYHSHAFH